MNDIYTPIFLIGAARSGTKLVRDVTTIVFNIDKIPYDINFIWRIGNENLSHDELSVDLLTPTIKSNILKHINSYHKNSPFLIEKTVSNCLRVKYVLEIFPNAKFIHLTRNGYDVIESVYRQWIAPPDWKYIIKKSLSFPLNEFYKYVFQYGIGIINKYTNKQKVNIWGPKYRGIQEDVMKKDLIEVCAIQWMISVEKAIADINQINHVNVYSMTYENFIRNPQNEFAGMVEKFNLTSPNFDQLSALISKQYVGRGLSSLSEIQKQLISPYVSKINDLLINH